MGHPNIQWGNIWGYPNIQGATFGASKHTRGIQTYGGIQTYMGCPNMGHSNIQGAIQTYGASKHTGFIHMYGGIWTPPQCDIVDFLCVVYVQGACKH